MVKHKENYSGFIDMWHENIYYFDLKYLANTN